LFIKWTDSTFPKGLKIAIKSSLSTYGGKPPTKSFTVDDPDSADDGEDRGVEAGVEAAVDDPSRHMKFDEPLTQGAFANLTERKSESELRTLAFMLSPVIADVQASDLVNFTNADDWPLRLRFPDII
jgi:hypothetical protein